MGKLRIEKRVLGMVRTNSYLVINTETREAFLVDPADSAEVIRKDIDAFGVQPAGILLTHGHFDHMGAAVGLAEHYGIGIGAGTQEADVMEDPAMNLSIQFGKPFVVKADRLYSDKEEFCMAGFQIRVLHTPGHTKGGVCYYLPEEKVLFSGDTLFYESVGRSDFPTGSMSVLVHSVRELFDVLPDDTDVYPGHESATTIAHEKEYNPFV